MKNQILFAIFFTLAVDSTFAQDKKYKIVTIADSIGLGKHISVERSALFAIEESGPGVTYEATVKHTLFGGDAYKTKITSINNIMVGKEYFFNAANGVIASLNFGARVNDIVGDYKKLAGGISKQTWVYDKYAVTLYSYPNSKFWILITNLDYFQL